MDERFLQYYNEELQYLRELGAEFAEDFPKIAGRLGIKGLEVADPYVERLLEGFAFLTARVRLKQDAQFPRFTTALLDAVHPTFLGQMPSMAVTRFSPDPGESALAEGYRIPRGSSLLSLLGRGDQTRCEYRTAHDVTLWPLEVLEARYYPTPAALSGVNVPAEKGERAGVGLVLGTTGGQVFQELALDSLPVFLDGSGALAGLIYEQIVGRVTRVLARPAGGGKGWIEVFGPDCVRQVGFADDEALLPSVDPAFSGYRLLSEYFAFPRRFLFFAFDGIRRAVERCASAKLELVVLTRDSSDRLIDVVSADNFLLFCTPVVNLFQRRADRVQLNTRDLEYQVVPDRTRPMDFEVWKVSGVKGIGSTADSERHFQPLYARTDEQTAADGGTFAAADGGYFAASREPRRLSARQKRVGRRTAYLGSEVYVSLVSPMGEPQIPGLKQLEVTTWCTNRDLPLRMALGQGHTDFDLQLGGPLQSIRCVAGPTQPRESFAEGDTLWRLVNLLCVNYLSLTDTAEGARTLRNLLGVFADQSDPAAERQIDGVLRILSKPMVARLPLAGPQVFGRGLEIEVTMDESAFEGVGAFLLGAVLERFFARYVTMNSFTRTRIVSMQRGEVMFWPTRTGQRPLL